MIIYLIIVVVSFHNMSAEKIQIIIDSIDIDRVESFKFLVIIIDSKLNWNKHIDYISQKFQKILGSLGMSVIICLVNLLKSI